MAGSPGDRGFDHPILKSDDGQVELIQLSWQTYPELLVSTSGLGHGRMSAKIAEVADFILIHFNGTPVDEIPGRIEVLKRFGKPIVCNEDNKVGRKGALAAIQSLQNGASWGYMNNRVNQNEPFIFRGHGDDAVVYDMLKSFTEPR